MEMPLIMKVLSMNVLAEGIVLCAEIFYVLWSANFIASPYDVLEPYLSLREPIPQLFCTCSGSSINLSYNL